MSEDGSAARRPDEATARADRLASLGMLAAGVAHDFNNILTVISMRADLLGGTLVDSGVDPELYSEDLDAIATAATTAAGMTRQLMLFAGAGGGRPAEFDLAEVIGSLRPLLAGAHGSVIEPRFTLAPGLLVTGDQTQVEQVVMNLVINARDAVTEAMTTVGREPSLLVTLRPVTEAAEAAALAARVSPAATGSPPGWAVLEITDNGTGMSKGARDRAFDPFFTTKAPGRGTGLGLSVVFGIVERIGGLVDIESEEGAGTTVRVALPAIASAAASTATAEPAPTPASRAPAPTRILLVDDDTAVRAITTRILTSRGFAPTPVASAEEALAALDDDGGFALVVSDVVMPRMSGTALAEELLARRPELPVLLVSGFTPPKKLVEHPLLELLTKPLTGVALVAAIEMLLARAAEAAAGQPVGGEPVRA